MKHEKVARVVNCPNPCDTRKKFCYEHPDTARKYLEEGPCKDCQFRLLCDVPCVAYYNWWDARMAVLKKKYGME